MGIFTKQVQQLIEHLKQHGTHSEGDGEWAVTYEDSPFMACYADVIEWPESSGEQLTRTVSFGYYQIIEGDICYDPLVMVSLSGDAITRVRVQTGIGIVLPDDGTYAEEFLSLIWDRHFASRELACE